MRTVSLGALLMSLAACSAGSASESAAERGTGAPSARATGDGAPSDATGPTSGDGARTSNGQGSPSAGTLTAGVWDDNLNFDFFDKYVAETERSVAGAPTFSLDDRKAARAKWSQRSPESELDVAFILDTTGSMGDELAYLQVEIDSIAATVHASHPQMAARYGLVLYRDQSDEYLTRWFDFKPLEEFRANLAAQRAGGGGDFPEAVPEALEQMNKLTWRPGSVARMAFWVADAPHHVGTEATVTAQIKAAAESGVHIYPIAASGTDPLAELTMRSAAQITGGRFIFLTDDSGVGNTHAEPHIPCYYVTKLNSAIVRTIESELTGSINPTAPAEILRTVGNPTNGTCATTSNGDVTIY